MIEGDREKKIAVKREGERDIESQTDGEKMVSLHEGDREKKIAVKGQKEKESLRAGEKLVSLYEGDKEKVSQ